MGPQAGLATIGHNAQAEPLTFAERVEERMQWSGRPTVEGSWSETRLLLLFGLTLFGGAGLCVAQAARVQRSQESVRLAQSSH